MIILGCDQIIPNRLLEMDGLDSLQQMIPVENQLILSDEFHIEGGDVIIYNDYVFIGVYTRFRLFETYYGKNKYGFNSRTTKKLSQKEICPH